MVTMRWLLIGLIRLYQMVISPLTPSSCRFYPTCSNYCLESIKKHGVFRGLWLCVKRVVRCGPWHPGGYDPVP